MQVLGSGLCDQASQDRDRLSRWGKTQSKSHEGSWNCYTVVFIKCYGSSEQRESCRTGLEEVTSELGFDG